MMRRFVWLLALFLMSSRIMAYDSDDMKVTFDTGCLKSAHTPKESLFQRSIVPDLMFGLGSIARDYHIADDIHYVGGKNGGGGFLEADDILQFTPGAIMLGTWITLNSRGEQDWNDMGRMAFAGAVGFATEVALAGGLKATVSRERPDGSRYNSFPSGHAATSFFAATMLHKEYGETVSPWFSVAGYALAAGTCARRITSDNHWMSDIVAGAGIGMFSAEFAYWLNDALFHGEMKSGENIWPTDEEWSFGLYSFYNFDRIESYDDGASDALQPGYTMGVQAEHALAEWLGVSLSGELTDIRWCGDGDISISGNSIPKLWALHAGLTGHVTLAGGLAPFVEMEAGVVKGTDYVFEKPDGENRTAVFPSSLDLRARAGLAVRTSSCSMIRCFAGIGRYDRYGLMLNAGTSVNIVF